MFGLGWRKTFEERADANVLPASFGWLAFMLRATMNLTSREQLSNRFSLGLLASILPVRIHLIAPSAVRNAAFDPVLLHRLICYCFNVETAGRAYACRAVVAPIWGRKGRKGQEKAGEVLLNYFVQVAKLVRSVMAKVEHGLRAYRCTIGTGCTITNEASLPFGGHLLQGMSLNKGRPFSARAWS